MKKEIIIPEGMRAQYDVMHFAPATKVGDTIWVAGQVGVRDNGEIPDSVEEQAHIVFKRIKLVLEAAGASLDDVVELTSYHVDIGRDVKTLFAVKDQYFKKDYPSWTAAGVTALARPGLLMEFKAVAVIGAGG